MSYMRHSGTLVPERETVKNTLLLGDLIRSKYEEEDLGLPTPVFIARSGLEIAGTLCRHLGIRATGMLVASVDRPHESNSSPQEFTIGQFPTTSEIADTHLIVVDVVCRSGETLDFVTQRLSTLGAASVKSAVLYDMTPPASQAAEGQYRPDYYLEDNRSLGYAVFHWEWEEMMAERE
jgi:hypoxanthine phosphoribosyltransferase